MDIVDVSTFPWEWWRGLPWQKRDRGNPRSRQKLKYLDIITAFDIETTRIPELEQSIMYIWQWCFGDRCTVIGRTWPELIDFIEQLTRGWPDNARFCTFVHNLSFEFSFLRGVHEFAPEDVFAVKPRKILKACWGNCEFRCSYLHSNMSLREYLAKMGAEHQKLDLDYEAVRWPWDKLPENEIAYAVNDVVGLVEAITIEIAADGDNLYTFPLTSTGYVRRDAKRAMRGVHHSWLHDQLPDLETYHLLREAFRGGNCHANRYFADMTVEDGHSADRSSSYPDTVANCIFPVSAFYDYGPADLEEVLHLIYKRKRAVLMGVAISGLELRNPEWGCPYLSRDKCRNIIGGDYDNGRLLAAEYLETTITDVDLRIIVDEYKFSDIFFYAVKHARYGPLPRPLVDMTIEYYRRKTALKGVPGQEVYYTKSKNKANSIYGMMAQNPVKQSIIYQQHGVPDPETGRLDYYPLDDTPDEELLDRNNRRAFLCYQWGVWVTAWARYRLEEGIRLAHQDGAEFLYCDTDSVKYLGTIDWDSYNRERIADSLKSGAWADDPSGKRHYMGVYEQEHDMLQFKTLGAKKYCCIEPRGKTGELEIVLTVAGVGKTSGAEELASTGQGLDAFADGFTFEGSAGGLEAIYNDDPAAQGVTWYEPEPGHRVYITPNVTLRPSTYTLGLTADYLRLLRNVRYADDPGEQIDY